jgi:hypothetical protein
MVEILSTSAVSSTLSPPKEAHLYNTYFARINSRQRVQRIVQRHQVAVLVAANHGGFFQGDVWHPTSPFQVVAPRMLHQDSAHHLR